jgi:isocitrate dehydrogenase
MPDAPQIFWTLTDEAPLLATASFLPIVRAYAGAAGIEVGARDISLAARILAQFPEAPGGTHEAGEYKAEQHKHLNPPEGNVINQHHIRASLTHMLNTIPE